MGGDQTYAQIEREPRELYMNTLPLCVTVNRIPLEQICAWLALVDQHAVGESVEANNFSQAPNFGPSMLTRLSFLDSYLASLNDSDPVQVGYSKF